MSRTFDNEITEISIERVLIPGTDIWMVNGEAVPKGKTVESMVLAIVRDAVKGPPREYMSDEDAMAAILAFEGGFDLARVQALPGVGRKRAKGFMDTLVTAEQVKAEGDLFFIQYGTADE